MIDLKLIRDKKGVTLIELLIVLAIIGIISIIGIPEYGRFIAKSKVRAATNNLLQNMRLARTMAIKENKPYLLTFDYVANVYRIGSDEDDNGSLLDAVDEYGGATPARVVNLQTEHGINVVPGSANFTIMPPNGPNGIAIADALSFQFNPDGSADSNPNGTVYFQYNAQNRGYTFCVELANSAGLIDLYVWQGHASNAGETGWNELR